ncbi:MAG TPA: diacylglycerol kinase [Candidatus Eisenbacteria bacterium]|jgi:diacylglycerol kinase|nr:diacylglycerol kinase [Candidatus Eisenbacteria bacterium]
MLDFNKFGRSLRYAAKGIAVVAREEQSFRLQLVGAVAVTIMMFVLDLRTPEKALLTLAMVLVLVLELVNSIFERMVDILKPRIHHYVEDIKDIMAGTVLIASVGALLIGVLIFWPYFVRLIAGT